MKDPVIIFDFDGTIADTLEYFFVIGNELAREFKFKNVKRHQIDAYRNKSIRQLIRTLDVPIFKIPRMLLKGKQELNNRIHEVQLIEGVGEVLLQLKKQNVRLGLVSTNSMENIQGVLRNYGLDDIFDFICISSRLLGKPRLLKRAIDQHELNVDRTLYVGDEIRDIEASRRAGLSVVSVTWGYNGSEILQAYAPDYLIDHPHELLQIFEEMKETHTGIAHCL